MYHFIAEGIVCDNTWYRSLEGPSDIPDIASFVENRAEKNLDKAQEIKTQGPSHDSQLPLADLSNDSTESDSEEDDSEETLNQFVSAMNHFKDIVVKSYKNTLKKGVKYFTKKLNKFSKQKETTLEKSLFSIGKELNKPKTGGKKRKTGKLIPIQVAAKSRRQYKHRGRRLGVPGRRPKDQENRVQMVVREEDESVYHSLPKQKKTKPKPAHSLKLSVEENHPAAKKH